MADEIAAAAHQQRMNDLADNENDDEATRQRKRKERLEQNRISARESRKRKKTMIEELQRTVITLSRENKDLNERNETLRRQLMEIASKYPNIVPLQAIMGQTPPATQSAEIGNVVLGAMAQQAEQASSVSATAEVGGDSAIPATALNTMSWLAPQQGKPAEPSGTTTDSTAAE